MEILISSCPSLSPSTALLTTPLLVSSAATAYCRLCNRCENMGSLEGRIEGMEEHLKVAAEYVDRLRGQIPIERQLPDLWREDRSMIGIVILNK